MLAKKWHLQYSQMVHFVRVRMELAVARRNSLRIRGSHPSSSQVLRSMCRRRGRRGKCFDIYPPSSWMVESPLSPESIAEWTESLCEWHWLIVTEMLLRNEQTPETGIWYHIAIQDGLTWDWKLVLKPRFLYWSLYVPAEFS